MRDAPWTAIIPQDGDRRSGTPSGLDARLEDKGAGTAGPVNVEPTSTRKENDDTVRRVVCRPEDG